MSSSYFAKTLSLTTVGATLLSISFISAPSAQAAIIGVGNSGSWATGSNTLSNLGFNLVSTQNSPQPEYQDLSSLSSSLGTVSFNRNVNKRIVSSGWLYWSHGYTGEVYFTQAIADANPFSTLTINLPSGIGAFDFYAQPNLFGAFSISAAASNGSIVTQTIDGTGGAQYFGFYSTIPSQFLTSITITADPGASGFAVGELRLANALPVPTPALLPGLIGLGLGVWHKRKGKRKD